MRKTILPLITLFAATCFISCDKNTNPESTEKIPIRISSSVTKVSGDTFEQGDAIGLYVVNATENEDGSWESGTLADTGNHLDNIRYEYKGSWNADKEYYWKDARTQADFYCYYPYNSKASNVESIKFTTPVNQSTLSGFKSAEILWGHAALKSPSEEYVNILTSHMMCQFVIEVKPGKGFNAESLYNSISKIRVNNVMNQSVLNLKTGMLYAEGSPTDIAPYYDGKTYRIMLAPQTVLATSPLITITIDGRERTLSKNIQFVSNTRKKCTITIDKLNEGINVSIGGWIDDGTDYGGTLN